MGKASRYESTAKRAASANPIVLGARAASWFYWGMVVVLGVMIVGATYWLLTHPLAEKRVAIVPWVDSKGGGATVAMAF